MERARRELFIDMAVRGPILKTRENNTLSCFTFSQKSVQVFRRQELILPDRNGLLITSYFRPKSSADASEVQPPNFGRDDTIAA